MYCLKWWGKLSDWLKSIHDRVVGARFGVLAPLSTTRNQGFMAHLINLICPSTYVHLRPILYTFEANSLQILYTFEADSLQILYTFEAESV